MNRRSRSNLTRVAVFVDWPQNPTDCQQQQHRSASAWPQRIVAEREQRRRRCLQHDPIQQRPRRQSGWHWLLGVVDAAFGKLSIDVEHSPMMHTSFEHYHHHHLQEDDATATDDQHHHIFRQRQRLSPFRRQFRPQGPMDNDRDPS